MKRIIRAVLISTLVIITACPVLPFPGSTTVLPPGLSFTGTARASASPDLIIEDISWSPEFPSIGDTVEFSVVLKNQGSDPSGRFHSAFYIDDTLLTTRSTGPLEPGADETESFSWEAVAGSHSIRAVTDADSEVTESDETNNQATFYFSVRAPDLTVEAITWTPESPSLGDSIAFNITVKNRGNERANSSRLYFYIDGASRGYTEVPRLDAGATSNQTFNWIAQAGSHELKAFIDEPDLVTEGDETNNEKTAVFITLAPDLIIEAITWSPASPSESENVTFKVNIKNQGAGTADYSTLDYYIDDTLIDSVPVDPIEAGATDNQTFNWVVKSGAHEIKAIADSLERVVEEDEENNEKTVLFAPLIPDLVIGAITWSPDSPSIGETVTFSVPVRNQGTGRAGISRVYFYVDGSPQGYQQISSIEGNSVSIQEFTWKAEAGTHTIKAIADEGEQVVESNEDNNEQSVIFSSVSFADLVIKEITWLPASPALGDTVSFTVTIKNQGTGRAGLSRVEYYIDGTAVSSATVAEIDAGATEKKSFNWTAVVGEHKVRAVADSASKVMESSEDNNEKTATITPRAPDLAIAAITPSTTVAPPGETVDFSVIIKNQGTLKADASRVHFYIDGTSLGFLALPEIEAAASATRIFSWKSQDGTHEIEARADPDENVIEADESNNARTIIFSIPPPDLVIEEMVLSPEEPEKDEAFTLSVTLRNQGEGQAAPTFLRLYSNSASIAGKEVPEIDPSAKATATFDLVLGEGLYLLEVVADSDRAIAESDEGNNSSLVEVDIRPPPAPGTAPNETPPASVEKPPEDSVYLNISANTVKSGEELTLDLSASNLVGAPPLTVKLTLTVPAGLKLSSGNFTAGNNEQYTAIYRIQPGDIKQIPVRVKTEKEGNFSITGDLIYYFGENEAGAQSKPVQLPITVSPAQIPKTVPEVTPEPEEGLFSDWRIILGVIAVIGLLITLLISLRRQ